MPADFEKEAKTCSACLNADENLKSQISNTKKFKKSTRQQILEKKLKSTYWKPK